MKNILTVLAIVFTTTIFSQSSIIKDIGEFSEVKVFDLINVKMIKSDKNQVVIEGRNRRNVEILNKNGLLKIRMELEESYDGNDVDIVLYYSSVEIIDANEGAEIVVEDTINQFDVKFKAQEGGKIEADIKTTYANVRAVTGGIINLTGQSKNQDVSIYTGGIFNGKDLITKETDVTVNAAGEARINATDFVEVRVRVGGDVYIYGNPKEIDEKTVLGGRVKRM